MASASFGRKGLSADMVGQQPARRRAFGQALPAREESAEPIDPAAERRSAFLAAERARAADVEPGEDGDPPAKAGAAPTVLVGGKSLGTAYLLWFFLGGFSAHRIYLSTPLTAIAQVSLWYISLMFYMAGHPGAGYLVTAGWLWILGDAFFMPKLRDAANEKIRRRAERLAEPVSS
jgi:TM2 domain-containing membrane protein YozV